MTFEFAPRGDIGREKWDAFVDASDEAWLWHRWDLIDAISCRESSEDVSFGLVSPEGEVLAVVPLYRAKGFRFSKVPSDTCWLYCAGGPAVVGKARPNLRRKVIAAVSERLPELIKEHGALFMEARLPAVTPCLHGENAMRVNPLFHYGFHNASGATWLVDLTPPLEIIRRRYSEITKRSLKKGANANIRMREASGHADLETYYKLHLSTIERLRSTPDPLEFFQLIFEKMLPEHLARIVFLEQDGKALAANIVVSFKRGAYYWLGASVTEKNDYEGRVLMDEQIAYARVSGCSIFETGKAYVAGDNEELVRGTSDFKRSFGSELVNDYSGRILAVNFPLKSPSLAVDPWSRLKRLFRR